MDIHKPKPWHGVREFLKEYVIIVVGVLTALGAEQLVEHLRWEGAVEEARASIHQEIAFNGGFFAERARGRGRGGGKLPPSPDGEGGDPGLDPGETGGE